MNRQSKTNRELNDKFKRTTSVQGKESAGSSIGTTQEGEKILVVKSRGINKYLLGSKESG